MEPGKQAASSPPWSIDQVLQEILHRSATIDRREAIGDAMAATLGVVDEGFDVVSDLGRLPG